MTGLVKPRRHGRAKAPHLFERQAGAAWGWGCHPRDAIDTPHSTHRKPDRRHVGLGDVAAVQEWAAPTRSTSACIGLVSAASSGSLREATRISITATPDGREKTSHQQAGPVGNRAAGAFDLDHVPERDRLLLEHPFDDLGHGRVPRAEMVEDGAAADPGAYHAFDALPGPAVADQARADRLAALRRALAIRDATKRSTQDAGEEDVRQHTERPHGGSS